MTEKHGLGADDFLRALEGACAELAARQEEINELNVFPVPDGDTGTNMLRTLEAAWHEAGRAHRPGMPLGPLAKAAARGSLWGARGNSGVILSQFLRGWAEGLDGCERASAARIVHAFEQAVETAYRAVMEPVEGTMLSVGRGAAIAARQALRPGVSVRHVVTAAWSGARTALEKTPSQLAILRQAGVVDAGGMGLVAILDGALKVFRRRNGAGTPVLQPEDGRGERVSPQLISAGELVSGPAGRSRAFIPSQLALAPEPASLEYTYCTEFVLKGHGLPQERLREQLTVLGDSLLVVGDEEALKIHLHTNHPGRALEIALEHGSITNVQISNMAEQVQQKAARHLPPALVAVVPGPGFADIFRSLGVSGIVMGGQTMNPSTQEIAEVIGQQESHYVLVLPNNKNVLMAAQQAARLVPDKKVIPLPSVTVPQGIAAVLAYQPPAPGEPVGERIASITRSMEEAMTAVRSGEVTVAIRDFSQGATSVQAGEFMGLEGDALLAAGTDLSDVVTRLVTQLGGQEAETVTLYYGDGVSAEEAAALAALLQRVFPEPEIGVYYGGQPHYPYVISVE